MFVGLPRNPLELFRTFIVMRMNGVRSLREMARLLNVDSRFRKICLIEEGEKGYSRSVLSHFTKQVGAERLKRIIEEKVVKLLNRDGARGVDAVLDASFIKLEASATQETAGENTRMRKRRLEKHTV